MQHHTPPYTTIQIRPVSVPISKILKEARCDEAMRSGKVVGLARAVLFRRERVLKLEPRGKGIVATSLHFARN